MSSAPRGITSIPAVPTARLRCRIDSPRGPVAAPDGRVLVAGVAAAEPGGVVQVEVRIDGGPWQPAEPDTEHACGRLHRWRIELSIRPGLHRVHARVADPPGAAAPPRWTRPMPGWSVREFVVA